jgi:NAD(P)H-dependent flavin oxidoreductase YrpB (nitropropane dioxygenase family)
MPDPTQNTLPRLIQGGMGVGVSSWRLAQAVSARGQLGVVSGTAIDAVLVRRLQDGDPGGHIRRALARFPVSSIAEAALDRYFSPDGRETGQPYRRLPMLSHRSPQARLDLCVLGAFVEVDLAREGHLNPVGINLLTKVQLPNLAALYGAILAGVDYVLMGAGIPREIPGALDALSQGRVASLRFDVTGAGTADPPPLLTFDPAGYELREDLPRPAFLAIVASHTLATMLARKSSGAVAGFVVEGPRAGGHNAPPRGTPTYDGLGQPLYGERDAVDLNVMRGLEHPFWLAGGITSSEHVQEALDAGAAGVQVGTLFAFCRESGVDGRLRRDVIAQVRAGTAEVRTDPRASSTGYPFKVATVSGTMSEADAYAMRPRVCDHGYLREAYIRGDGGIGYRCASEPVVQYVAKGGRAEDTVGRKCLCNGLLATVGLAQIQKDGTTELPIVTSGDEISAIANLLRDDTADYSASDVIEYLLPGGSDQVVAQVGAADFAVGSVAGRPGRARRTKPNR